MQALSQSNGLDRHADVTHNPSGNGANMLLSLRRVDNRPPAMLRQHYEVEKELADRLRHATREERRILYGTVYDELYQRVPHHPSSCASLRPS